MSCNPNDVINNVYDLYGNSYEWTLEAFSNDSRVLRGGHYLDDSTPVNRYYDILGPYATTAYFGSRLTLYIK